MIQQLYPWTTRAAVTYYSLNEKVYSLKPWILRIIMDGLGWHHLNPFINNSISKTGTKHLVTPDVKQYKVASTAQKVFLPSEHRKQKHKNLQRNRVSTLISKLQERGFGEKEEIQIEYEEHQTTPESGQLSRECILTSLACMGGRERGKLID